MQKVEIEEINNLINKGYPEQIIKELLEKILIYSLPIKQDYPDYKLWFINTQTPGIYDNTRNIIIAHIDKKIVGFASLKKTNEEKKICTFYVEKKFRKNKIGLMLLEKSIEYLETEQPLITIPMDKLNEFIKLGNKYNWKVTDIKENLYRTEIPEVIVNGELKSIEKTTNYTESDLKKVYKIYKIEQRKEQLKFIINRICGNNI